MKTQAASAHDTKHLVGYTVLRAGAGAESRVCLVSPYVGEIKKAEASGDSVTLTLSACQVGLTALPQDVAELLANSPERVLLVSVDTLASVRQSGSLAELSSTVH